MKYIRTIRSECNLNTFLEKCNFSKKDIYFLKNENRIMVNGKIVKNDFSLNKNDTVEIDICKDENIDICPTKSTLDILYEDDICLIVNKPIGIIIHDDYSNNALDNYVAYYYNETNQKHGIYHVHRLDKETSGIILYCKERYMLPYFEKILESKQLKRTYLAIVEGIIEKKITINKPLGRDRHESNKYRISKTGKEAITIVEPVKYFNNKTLVKCNLLTGRTHQIRVHLASISHPIVGDILYNKANYKRMLLHSYHISFIHPITQKPIEIECKPEF